MLFIRLKEITLKYSKSASYEISNGHFCKRGRCLKTNYVHRSFKEKSKQQQSVVGR